MPESLFDIELQQIIEKMGWRQIQGVLVQSDGSPVQGSTGLGIESINYQQMLFREKRSLDIPREPNLHGPRYGHTGHAVPQIVRFFDHQQTDTFARVGARNNCNERKKRAPDSTIRHPRPRRPFAEILAAEQAHRAEIAQKYAGLRHWRQTRKGD